mmetsp:Transcript_11894/g.32802  ORF Transcript_11894/g.32802 Transcript_11894/m.32802 type:complete len:134 (-) Transcript_11894:496-897(-)
MVPIPGLFDVALEHALWEGAPRWTSIDPRATEKRIANDVSGLQAAAAMLGSDSARLAARRECESWPAACHSLLDAHAEPDACFTDRMSCDPLHAQEAYQRALKVPVRPTNVFQRSGGNIAPWDRVKELNKRQN